MKALIAEELQTVRWLLERRQRRETGHPETVRHLTIELAPGLRHILSICVQWVTDP